MKIQKIASQSKRSYLHKFNGPLSIRLNCYNVVQSLVVVHHNKTSKPNYYRNVFETSNVYLRNHHYLNPHHLYPFAMISRVRTRYGFPHHQHGQSAISLYPLILVLL